ncbi:MAG: hypothetical protein A3G52_01915 [Candidatus Taylorbacteria bacterium RIFCSPLOWO2_12_FULL_43_20]|uniref:Glycogen synthase n=1 Tax=Candidatus Taylorbacteria bacterium RIFCSPLOWO2_12_FULL_43_20 TaxID=1802332 RepID=A0A1G2P3R3_9BACT|nr:MAG: hypothetical protein A2825_02010 [Candidatus Taylorbacteria bacterium RIFCSPHIGHO2_01_FULL_43_120]OHA23008.1 MAG: hypothetical protein A3B98_01885 [Candidatus Taylorbacteria bacterium RIFCSPHIGHO2_02_FULL_43_55]OHA30124.1 MAG: hypothetical protein A3E92_00920 [Candidatus Taylorbacteria bacterium RIFCSPHIGHO2_12_FULL_42_34]OHA30722.1 MAG: hypothetical protein A3B09_01675 [Candidatus Taylorbacteria bacterium RIFCSPLOWO2_01_FULL_43_83]OHA39595.1 MAG: hypothetical protein A3H58_02360 [Candi
MKIFTKKSRQKILFVATEAKPFARAGGLGSVMYSLPRAMAKLGYDARVMMPRYLSIEDSEKITMEYEGLEVPTDNEDGDPVFICNVKKYQGNGDKNAPVTTYFLENMEYYEQRANVYGYADDPIRWALLSRGVLEFIKVSSWVPDVIISADWQTGFLPNYLKTTYKDDPKLSTIATVFSIHNLGYQGSFNHRYLSESDYDDGHSSIPSFNNPRLLKLNGIRRGIMYADAINTVSMTYAKEIMTPEYGEGMDAILSERRGVVHGILNGIDYESWDPSNDPLIEHQFSIEDISSRKANKEALQNRFGLKGDASAFLVGIASRFKQQKGFDLLQEVLPSLVNELNIQIVAVGEGDEKYMKFFQDLHNQYPERVGIELKFDEVIPHLIFAGADSTLIPSLFEPSGLTQMEAMRFGTVPIVRKTGGLADTVIDYSPTRKDGDGFVFEKFDASSLLISIVRAYENFQNIKIWKGIQKNSMKKDFSWESSAMKYQKLVHKAIKINDDALAKKAGKSLKP